MAINEPHKFISLIEFYMENVCVICFVHDANCQPNTSPVYICSHCTRIDRSIDRLSASECDISILKITSVVWFFSCKDENLCMSRIALAKYILLPMRFELLMCFCVCVMLYKFGVFFSFSLKDLNLFPEMTTKP